MGIKGKFLDTLKANGFGELHIYCSQAMYNGDNITCKVAGISTMPMFLTRGLRQVIYGCIGIMVIYFKIKEINKFNKSYI